MQQRDHLVEIAGASVVDYFDAAQLNTRLSRGGANPIFAAQDRDPGQTLAHSIACCHNSPRVFAFGQNDVLWIRGGPLPDLIKYGHDSGQLSVWMLDSDGKFIMRRAGSKACLHAQPSARLLHTESS